MRYILFLFLTLPLFAANILNINIKEADKKIEIFFNFDTPYKGRIIQKVDKDKIKLILKDAKTFSSWSKKIDSPFIYQVELIPKGNDSELNLYTIEKAAVVAAKSSDGYGLKLTIKKFSAVKKENKSSKKDVKKEEKNEYNLFLFIIGGAAIIIIFVFIIFLFIPKKDKIKKKTINVQNPKESELEIKFEKKLDDHNKIALISFKGINYLVIIGSTNILLGKYPQKIESQEDFERLIEESEGQIKDIFVPKEDQELLNELESYKEKASR